MPPPGAVVNARGSPRASPSTKDIDAVAGRSVATRNEPAAGSSQHEPWASPGGGETRCNRARPRRGAPSVTITDAHRRPPGTSTCRRSPLCTYSRAVRMSAADTSSAGSSPLRSRRAIVVRRRLGEVRDRRRCSCSASGSPLAHDPGGGQDARAHLADERLAAHLVVERDHLHHEERDRRARCTPRVQGVRTGGPASARLPGSCSASAGSASSTTMST